MREVESLERVDLTGAVMLVIRESLKLGLMGGSLSWLCFLF